MLDKDGDGSVSVEELGEAFKSFGNKIDQEEASKMIKELESSGNFLTITPRDFSDMLKVLIRANKLKNPPAKSLTDRFYKDLKFENISEHSSVENSPDSYRLVSRITSLFYLFIYLFICLFVYFYF